MRTLLGVYEFSIDHIQGYTKELLYISDYWEKLLKEYFQIYYAYLNELNDIAAYYLVCMQNYISIQGFTKDFGYFSDCR